MELWDGKDDGVLTRLSLTAYRVTRILKMLGIFLLGLGLAALGIFWPQLTNGAPAFIALGIVAIVYAAYLAVRFTLDLKDYRMQVREWQKEGRELLGKGLASLKGQKPEETPLGPSDTGKALDDPLGKDDG